MGGGRLSAGPGEALDALNRSLPVDHRLWPQDVAASKAWVHALGRVGVVTANEEPQLLEGLDRVAERLADGAAVGAPDEDVHTLVERLLYAEVGAVAGKLHTGRSRNDQVATDLRLWTLEAIDQVDGDIAALGRALVARAQDGVDVLLPGYTHGQRAQPEKRNPDVLELARAKSGRLLGDLVALLTTLKGLPAGYSKDLQEDKALLFDAFDTLGLVLPAVTGAVAALTLDAERMRGALDASLRATDLADLLVESGVPFRESHGLVGRLVREAERSRVPLAPGAIPPPGGGRPAQGPGLAQLGTLR